MNNLSKMVQDALEQAAAPSILTWKSRKIEGALVTKIGPQRYLGVIRKDKNGQEYWRYHLLTNATESSVNSIPKPAPISEASSPAQPSQVEHSPEKDLEDSKVVEESETVIKFREKFPNKFSTK